MALFGDRRFFKLEARAEKRAVIEVGSTSSVDILRASKMDIKYPSFESKKDRKGNIIGQVDCEVRGQDIFDKGTWQKFLAHINRNNADLISLVNDLKPLTTAYDSFLDTAYTERYRNLDGKGKKWRLKSVRKAVKYHILENKLDGYLEGDDTFADEKVAYYYTLVRAIKTAMAGAARAINHIIKDTEKAQEYLDIFFSTHYEQFRSAPFPQRDELLRLIEPDDDEEEEEYEEETQEDNTRKGDVA